MENLPKTTIGWIKIIVFNTVDAISRPSMSLNNAILSLRMVILYAILGTKIYAKIAILLTSINYNIPALVNYCQRLR